MGLVASADAGSSLSRLYKLNITAEAVGSAGGSTPPKQGDGPSQNNGNAKKHGGDNHDAAINSRVNELKNDANVQNIRKNQQQVNVNGKKVGTNRPDIQYNKYNTQTGKWEHHNVEYDNNAASSVAHGRQIKANDPSSLVNLNVL